MSLKFAKASLSLGFTSSTVVATRLKVQCHGIKHDALNNSYSKSYRRDIKTFTTNAAKINMKRRTEFCSGNAGDLKYFLRVWECVWGKQHCWCGTSSGSGSQALNGERVSVNISSECIKRGEWAVAIRDVCTGNFCEFGALKDPQQLLYRHIAAHHVLPLLWEQSSLHWVSTSQQREWCFSTEQWILVSHHAKCPQEGSEERQASLEGCIAFCCRKLVCYFSCHRIKES